MTDLIIDEEKLLAILYQAYFFGIPIQQDKLPVKSFVDWAMQIRQELKKESEKKCIK